MALAWVSALIADFPRPDWPQIFRDLPCAPSSLNQSKRWEPGIFQLNSNSELFFPLCPTVDRPL